MNIRNNLKSFMRTLFGFNRTSFRNKPVFIVTCGRSGSTAFCTALGKHPQIFMAEPEGPFISRFGSLAKDYAYGEKAEYYRHSIKLSENEFRNMIREMCFMTTFGTSLGLLYHPFHAGQSNSVYKGGNSYKYWGVKAFLSQEVAAGILWLYPEAKFIYLFRNGLDVVSSMTKFGDFSRLDFTERCRLWSDSVFQFDYLRQMENAISVRFEDFLTDNEAVYNTVQKFLDLSYDPGPTGYASTTLVHPLNEPTRNANPAEVLNNRRSGYEDWDDTQKQLFKDNCSQAMNVLSYTIPF